MVASDRGVGGKDPVMEGPGEVSHNPFDEKAAGETLILLSESGERTSGENGRSAERLPGVVMLLLIGCLT